MPNTERVVEWLGRLMAKRDDYGYWPADLQTIEAELLALIQPQEVVGVRRCSHPKCSKEATKEYMTTRVHGRKLAEAWYPRCDNHPLGNAKRVRPLTYGGQDGQD